MMEWTHPSLRGMLCKNGQTFCFGCPEEESNHEHYNTRDWALIMLSEAQSPTHRKKEACEDSGVMLSDHKWPTR